MKISIVDKDIQNTLDLTSDELVRLLRYKKIDTRSTPFTIVSPVIIVCDDKKFEVDVLDIPSLRGDEMYGDFDNDISMEDAYYMRRYQENQLRAIREETDDTLKERIEPVEAFTLKVELSSELFAALVPTSEILILFRVQNAPAYTRTSKVRVDYNKQKDKVKRSGENRPALIIKIDQIKPIVDLLKAQITESAFYEVFIEGKSDEFYDAKDNNLDEIVELIGIKRRSEETDIALRTRVISYLKLRMTELSKVQDDDLKELVDNAQLQADIEKKLNDAEKKNKRKKRDSTNE